MFIPAFRGVSGMTGEDGESIAGLVNPRVCVAIPPCEQTPVPVGVPKTGYMIESMVSAVAENIRTLIAGKEPGREPTWNAVWLADFDDAGVAFVALPQIPPRNVNWAAQGYWVYAAKVAFEKYFLHKVRKGRSEPVYERFVMKTLRIPKLRRDSHASTTATAAD
jgi:sulfide:quinone oxidoreductase